MLDFSDCKEYIDYVLKYRMGKIKEDGLIIYNFFVDDIFVSLVVLWGLFLRFGCFEENFIVMSLVKRVWEKVKLVLFNINLGLY